MIFSLALPAPAATQAGTTLHLQPATVTLHPGQSAAITIWVEDVTDLTAFSVQVTFDPASISANDLQHGPFLDMFLPEPTNGIDNEAGIILYGMTQGPADDPKSGSGVLFSFSITAKTTPGQTPLAIAMAELVDADYFLIPVEKAAGEVRVTGALPDAYQLSQDLVLEVPPPGVLANDIGPPDADLSAELVDPLPPDEGELNFSMDGGFTYTPPAGWTGTTGFTYRACAGEWCSAPAAVTITVLEDPLPPIAVDDVYQAAVNQPLEVPAPGVLTNDHSPSGLPLTAEWVDPPGEGDLDLHADGGFSYTPPVDWTGATTFTYQACDAFLCSDPATVTITVLEDPLPPIAVDDVYQAAVNQPLEVPAPGVLTNDQSPSGLPLTAELVDSPGDGDLDLHADGGFSYTPPTDWIGTASFTYQACDAFLCSEPATVTVTIIDREYVLFLPLILH